GVDVAPLLALPQTAITRRGVAPTRARPIGSGPFVVEGFDPVARRLALKAFDDHFAGRPYLDRLGLSWFDTPAGEARRVESGVGGSRPGWPSCRRGAQLRSPVPGPSIRPRRSRAQPPSWCSSGSVTSAAA